MRHTEDQSGVATSGRRGLILGKSLLLGPFAFQPLLGALVELALEGLRLLLIRLAPSRDGEQPLLWKSSRMMRPKTAQCPAEGRCGCADHGEV